MREKEKAAGAAQQDDAKVMNIPELTKDLEEKKRPRPMKSILINAEPKESELYNNHPWTGFETWGLPNELQSVVKEVSEGYQCSPDIPAVAMFSAAATALGKRVQGIFDNYTNYPAMWFVIVGRASSGKTAPVDFIYKPIIEREKSAFEKYGAERAEYENTPKDKRGTPPRLHSLLAGNVTDEKLLYKLAENGGSLCWKHDEFATMFGGMGKYSNGGSGMIIGNLLSMFSQSDFSIERVMSEPLYISNPALNIISTTQPAVLKRLMMPYISQRNGLFERFNFVYVRDDTPPYKRTLINEESVIAWRECIDRLLRLEPHTIQEHPKAYKWHTAAIDRWRNNARLLNDDVIMDEEAFDDTQASIYSKAEYMLCRIAIIVAELNGDTIISPTTMQYSIEVVDYLISHQIRTLFSITNKQQREPSKGEALRQLRRAFPELNQSQLSRALGVSQQYVNKELNKR